MCNILKSELYEINKKRAFQSKYGRAMHVYTRFQNQLIIEKFENLSLIDTAQAGLKKQKVCCKVNLLNVFF